MSRSSWEERIRRAEELTTEYPASAEVLRFYGQVAQFQKVVYERLRAESEPVQTASLESDFPQLLQLIQRIGPDLLAATAGELEKAHTPFTELLAAARSGMDAGIGTPDHLLFFVRVLLQPYAERTSDQTAPATAEIPARCPMCGEWPQTAALRTEGDGAKRWLVCSLCSSEWEFRRTLCPLCGEADKDHLPVFTSALFGHILIEACDQCRGYIKAIDLTKNGRAIPWVDDLASIPLDLWAEDAGYNKLQRNILGL
jgi:FdhE protein